MEKKYKLVIVESPSKAKTIEKYLGPDYRVIASKGHIMDLPKKKLGVDLLDFSTEIVPIEGKESTISEIIKMAKDASIIYLASDDDREGESIAFHLRTVTKRLDSKRVIFNVITKSAIIDAINNPVELDQKKYEAQQSRRILDRLIGYKISPILWEKIQPGLSAGRVQSVTLKIIVKREEEILKFIPERWFDILADFSFDEIKFQSKFIGENKDTTSKIKDKKEVDDILASIKGLPFNITDIQTKDKILTTQPPYTTSKLQQEASSKLGFGAKQTMQVAQKLYEGIEIRGVGRTGLITYMRTDSVRSEPVAVDTVRQLIKDTYGESFLNKDIIVHKQKKTDSKVQDAHEAIRPANLTLSPTSIKGDLTNDEFLLYQLIWNKFIASQMSDSISEITTNTLKVDKYFFVTKGSVLKFEGYKKVFNELKEKDDDEEDSLPLLTIGQSLVPTKDPYYTEKASSPPPRFNEGSLVKELEDKGIGRPATYANIISNIEDRKYVEKNKDKRYNPTELGTNLCHFLDLHFPDQMDISFTSKTEQSLDDIEEGNILYKDLLKHFWEGLFKEIEKVQIALPSIKREGSLDKNSYLAKLIEASKTGIKCKECEGEYLVKKGTKGEFLACSKYPECKSTKNFEKDKKGVISIIDGFKKNYSGELCNLCGKKMVIIEGKNGKFLSCEDYPNCKSTQAMPSKASCPKCKIGKLVERKTKAGKFFHGCNKYPSCDFVVWDELVFKKCKHCNNDFLIKDLKNKKKICFACRKEN
jgi:DNA topoisomerase-1